MLKPRLSILLAIILSITIVIAFFSSYRFLQQRIRQDINHFSENVFIEQYNILTHEIENRFTNVSKLTHQTAHLIEERLKDKNLYSQAQIEKTFAKHLSKLTDGSYRTSVKDSTDYKKVQVFFSNRKEPTFLEKKIIVDGKKFFEPYARALDKIVFNTYFTTNHLHWDYGSWEWPLTVDADEDFNDQPWFYLADKNHDANRQQVWTPVYYDDVNKKWLISSLCPVYMDEQFIGVLGHDMLLEEIINLTKKETDNYGTLFYIDKEGAIIAHPETNATLNTDAKNNEQLKVQNLKDSNLNKLLDSIKGTKIFGNSTLGGKEKSVVFYAPLKTLDWTIVYIIESEVFEETTNNILNNLLRVLIITGLITIMFIVAIIHFFANKPLRDLQSAMLTVKNGMPGTIIKHNPYLQEFRKLISMFNEMSISLGIAYRDLENARKQLISIIDSTPILMILLNKEREILRINETGSNILGYSELEAKGKRTGEILNCASIIKGTNCMDNIKCKDCELQKLISSSLNENKNYNKKEIEINIDYKGTSRKHTLLASTSLMKDAEEPLLLLSIDDITDRIKTEKLKQEVEISKRSANLKQQFLANMSHEMRTPMTGIIGMTNFLSRTELNREQQEYVSIIKSSSENLLYLIDDILDISKIEQGRMVLKATKTNIKKAIEEVCSIFEETAKLKEINLKFSFSESFPEFVKIDKHRFKQVLTNLTSNAIKYTEKGNVNIFLELLEKNKSSVKGQLKVVDTGMGIDQNKQKEIFNLFYRLENTYTRNTEGTGLGLAIAKKVAELMDGELSLKSKIGEGSSFIFTFNAETFSEEEISSLQPEDINNIENLGLSILLAEDKLVNQKVVSLMLNQIGCKVAIAKNGEEVLETFEENKFDIILMDIMMPKMDGITATNKLKEIYSNLPPIIGLSAHALEGDAQRFIEMGLDDYLEKPINTFKLINKLDKWR